MDGWVDGWLAGVWTIELQLGSQSLITSYKCDFDLKHIKTAL